MIDKNNHIENKKRKLYDYQIGQKVLITVEQSRKYGKNPYQGPYEGVKISNNGSVRLKSLMTRGAVYQTFNIRQMSPFEE